ncbi:hypothetical protein [Tenacibaculum amylolyticum]|uniref:hypothetical protein n=1 Tax=Tenacibaculum amylolyticum TaxID=104269 RepID=UPI003893C890
MKLLKKSLVVMSVSCLTLTLFSFKSATANETNLSVAEVTFHKASVDNNTSTQAARITAVGRLAKKVWDRSGKEAAKFVAYEIVLRGVDYLLSAEDEIQGPASEANYKLSQL